MSSQQTTVHHHYSTEQNLQIKKARLFLPLNGILRPPHNSRCYRQPQKFVICPTSWGNISTISSSILNYSPHHPWDILFSVGASKSRSLMCFTHNTWYLTLWHFKIMVDHELTFFLLVENILKASKNIFCTPNQYPYSHSYIIVKHELETLNQGNRSMRRGEIA